MAIIPKIACPPDYSIRCFRLVDPMSYGIVKGAQTEISIPTKGICIPVDRYDDRRLILKANSTVKLDISGIASYGELAETYSFGVNLSTTPDILSVGTKHKYSLLDANLNLIETIEFTVTNSFSKDFLSAVGSSSQIHNLMNFDLNNVSSTGSFTVTAINTGIKYRHIFYFDLDGFGGADPYPYITPGNLVTKYRKYEEGRVKIILLIPEFAKVDTSKCGCSDTSGAMLSNKKYFKYALSSDVEKHKDSSTPIIVNGDDLGTSYVWSQNSKDHIGYHFAPNDLVNTTTATTKRALIGSINGYSFTTDTPIGNGTTTNLYHVWSPAEPTWRTAGEMSLFTGGQDVYDTDYLFIETLYLKNDQSFDIPMRVLIGV